MENGLEPTHWGGGEYQAEVALLSRRIVMTGEDSGDSFGYHAIVATPAGRGRYS